MKRASWLATAMLCAWFGSASAQTAPLPPPTPPDQTAPPVAAATPVPAAMPANDGVHVPADTQVRIAIAEQISSKDRKRGDKFALQLASPLVIDGHIVAPAGATGQGEVVYAEPGKGGGAPGKLVLAARYIDVGAVRVPLKAFHLASGGKDELTQMEVAAYFIGMGAMFIDGQNVVYPPGVRAEAKIAQDVTLPQGPPAPDPTIPATPPPAGAPPSAAPPSAAPASATATPTAPPVQEPAKQ